MENCVYVVRATGTDYYKIGVTRCLDNRMKGLQVAIPFWDLELVVVHYYEDHRELESQLHIIYVDKRLRNSEWFELSSDDLTTLMMKTIDLTDSLGLTNKKTKEVVKRPEGEAEAFVISRVGAANKLSAEMARDIESALGTEKYEPKWSHALEDYADKLDSYSGDSYSME